VAIGAGDILRRLVMRGAQGRYGVREGACIGSGMALQAKGINVRNIEQPRVGRAVRRVTGNAPLGLHYWVLIRKRAGSFRMAFHADDTLISGGAKLLLLECSVGIVAVAALNQALVYLVMEGLIEVGPNVCVARVAQHGLRHLEHVEFTARRMNAVTAGATDVGFTVGRTREIRMGSGMTTYTGCINRLGGSLAELQDLLYIPAGFNMSLPRTVTALACKTCTPFHQSQGRMRVVTKLGGLVAMTQSTGLVAGKATLRNICLFVRLGRLMSRWRLGKCRNSASTHQE
jgi:hypothetical protein